LITTCLGDSPEYNVKGFKSAVEVAFSLKELFDELKIISYIKTSGKLVYIYLYQLFVHIVMIKQEHLPKLSEKNYYNLGYYSKKRKGIF
jgi:hypothetical protein